MSIRGAATGSDAAGTLLGRVITPSPIGARTLTLDTAAGIQVGMWVRMFMSDVNGTLVKQLYGGAMERAKCGAACDKDLVGETDMVRWMVRVARVEGNIVTLQRPLPVAASPDWRAEVHRVPDSMPRNSGVRDLSVEFAWSRAAEHHGERGFNAFFIDGAVNAFLLNIAAVNVDSAVLVRNSHHVSVRELTVATTRTRAEALPWQGHIGVGLYDSSDVEVGFLTSKGSGFTTWRCGAPCWLPCTMAAATI